MIGWRGASNTQPLNKRSRKKGEALSSTPLSLYRSKGGRREKAKRETRSDLTFSISANKKKGKAKRWVSSAFNFQKGRE